MSDLARMMASPEAFRSALLVDTDAGVVRLGDVMDDWQSTDFARLDSGWRVVVGQERVNATQRAYLERGRGHSKTLDLAVMASWALFASRRAIKGVCGAADIVIGIGMDCPIQGRHRARRADQAQRLGSCLANGRRRIAGQRCRQRIDRLPRFEPPQLRYAVQADLLRRIGKGMHVAVDRGLAEIIGLLCGRRRGGS